MKSNYKTAVSLACQTCGGEDFDFNEDKTYVKCKTCEREYPGGYDELVQANTERVNAAVDDMKREITSDIKDHFRQAFKGNKFIKFK